MKVAAQKAANLLHMSPPFHEASVDGPGPGGAEAVSCFLHELLGEVKCSAALVNDNVEQCSAT